MLKARCEGLLELYRNTYAGDSVLIKIAENVIHDAAGTLR